MADSSVLEMKRLPHSIEPHHLNRFAATRVVLRIRIHPIRSGMLDLGEAVLDPVCVASHVEHMGTACLPSFGPRRCRYESSRWGMS